MLSNYPPGMSESSIPGINDRDTSYSATVSIIGIVDANDIDVCDLDYIIKIILADDYDIHTIDHNSVEIISIINNEVKVKFNIIVEGDVTIDPHHDDDQHIYDQIREDIDHQLRDYVIEYDDCDIEYKVH